MPTLDRLSKIFQKVYAHDPSEFSKELGPDDVAKWDSIGHMNMVAAMEEEFGLEFDIDEIMEMENVGRILEILEAKGIGD